jgi:hypothetical protein
MAQFLGVMVQVLHTIPSLLLSAISPPVPILSLDKPAQITSPFSTFTRVATELASSLGQFCEIYVSYI